MKYYPETEPFLSFKHAFGHLIVDTFVTGHWDARLASVHTFLGSSRFYSGKFYFWSRTFNDDTPSSLGVFHDDKLFPIKPEQMIQLKVTYINFNLI